MLVLDFTMAESEWDDDAVTRIQEARSQTISRSKSSQSGQHARTSSSSSLASHSRTPSIPQPLPSTSTLSSSPGQRYVSIHSQPMLDTSVGTPSRVPASSFH